MSDCIYCTRKVDTDSAGFVILSDLNLEQQLKLYDGEFDSTIETAKLAHSECLEVNEDVAIA